MKNVMLIGDAGYIGKNISHYLRGMGYSIIGIDLKNGIDGLYVNDYEFKEADVIINVAAHSDIEHEGDYKKTIRNNIELPLHIVEHAKKLKKRLIHFSSSGIHQKTSVGPYVLSKRMSECIIVDNLDDYAIVRPANVVGAYFKDGFDDSENGHILPRLYEATISKKPFYLYGDGNQIRDYVHVTRLCTVIEELVTIENLGKSVLEAFSGEEYTNNDVIKKWKEIVDPELEVVRDGTARRSDPDILSTGRIFPGLEIKKDTDDLIQAMNDYLGRYNNVVKPKTVGRPRIHDKKY